MTTEPSRTFVIGHMGRIEDVDDTACTLLGYSLAELRGLHGSRLILAEERARVAVSLDRMRRGEIERRRGRIVRKDGTPVPVEVTAERRAHGQLTLVVRLLSKG